MQHSELCKLFPSCFIINILSQYSHYTIRPESLFIVANILTVVLGVFCYKTNKETRKVRIPLTLPSSQTFCFVAACEKKQHELSVSLCYLLSTSVVRSRHNTDAAIRVQKLKFSLRSLTLRMKSFLAGFSVHFPLYSTAPEPLNLHPNHQGECRPNLTRTWYLFCSESLYCMVL